MGFEPMTSSLPRKCSTAELGQRLQHLPRRQRGKPYGNFRRGVKDGNENCFSAHTLRAPCPGLAATRMNRKHCHNCNQNR